MQFSKTYQPRKKKKPRRRLPSCERLPVLACYDVFGTPEHFTNLKNAAKRDGGEGNNGIHDNHRH